MQGLFSFVVLIAFLSLSLAHAGLKPRDAAPSFKAKAVIDDKVIFFDQKHVFVALITICL